MKMMMIFFWRAVTAAMQISQDQRGRCESLCQSRLQMPINCSLLPEHLLPLLLLISHQSSETHRDVFISSCGSVVYFCLCGILCNWVKSLCCPSDALLGNKHRKMSFNPGLELDHLTQLNIAALQEIHTLPLIKSPHSKPNPETSFTHFLCALRRERGYYNSYLCHLCLCYWCHVHYNHSQPLVPAHSLCVRHE